MSRDKTTRTNPRPQRSRALPENPVDADGTWTAVESLREQLDAGMPLEQLRTAAFLTVLELCGGDALTACGVATQALIELARTGAPRP